MNRLIFAGVNNDVQLLNELFLIGETGVWLTHTINRHNPGHEYTLQRVTLFYEADYDTRVIVRGSGNGGHTFLESYEIDLPESPDGICSMGFDITGPDIRLQFEIPDDAEGNLMLNHFTATIADRGPYVFPRL